MIFKDFLRVFYLLVTFTIDIYKYSKCCLRFLTHYRWFYKLILLLVFCVFRFIVKIVKKYKSKVFLKYSFISLYIVLS